VPSARIEIRFFKNAHVNTKTFNDSRLNTLKIVWKSNELAVIYFTNIMCLYTCTVIQAEPLMAPSYAQVAQRKERDDPTILEDVFMSSVKELLKNNGYILLLVSYGINVGAFFAISTLLNQFILLYFPVSKLNIDNDLRCIYYWNSGSRRRCRTYWSHVGVVRPRRFDHLRVHSRQNTSLQVRKRINSILSITNF